MDRDYKEFVNVLTDVRIRVTSTRIMMEEDLEEIESQLNFNISDEYKKFILAYSGIAFREEYFPLMNVEELGSVFFFYGSTGECSLLDIYRNTIRNFGEIDSDNFEWYPGIHLVRDEPDLVTIMGWPPELLPIGCSLQANEVCLAISGSRPGAIFYFISNPIEGEQNLYLVANSFDEFIDLIGSK